MAELAILHGNADIELQLAAHHAPEPNLFPERDDLRDPELIVLSHAYHAALISSARPAAPEPLA